MNVFKKNLTITAGHTAKLCNEYDNFGNRKLILTAENIVVELTEEDIRRIIENEHWIKSIKKSS